MRKILFTTDFGHPALPMAVELAGLKKAGLKEIVFLFVIDRDEVGFNVTTGFDAERAEELRESARARINEWKAVLDGEGIESSHIVEVGSPEGKILETAHAVDADLIVVGRKIETPLDDFYPWGVSMKIIRRSARPVLIHKFGEGGTVAAKPLAKVLFATDFSPASAHAAEWLAGLGKAVGRIDVVNVRKSRDESHGDGGAPVSEDTKRREALSLLSERFTQASIPSSPHLLKGDPASEILLLAAELDYKMIAAATTGKSGFAEVFHGSVSHVLADRAIVPVLLIPREGTPEDYA